MIELILIFSGIVILILYLLKKRRLIEKGVARIYEYGGLFYWNLKEKITTLLLVGLEL